MERIRKTDAEWREALDDETYTITRKKGTERAFSGKYNQEKRAGTYRCTCCGTALFDSEHKYDSGSGWPSFTRPVSAEHVQTEEDRSFFMSRTEVLCARCDAHLGHVFPDGPQPTGLRFCINSAALELEPRKEDEG